MGDAVIAEGQCILPFGTASSPAIPPARALFDAKIAYARDFPHGRTSTAQEAIEYKILREYTCLGLRW